MIRVEIRQALNGWIVELYGEYGAANGHHVFKTFDEMIAFLHVRGRELALTESILRLETRE
jgi:hypothetical protein